MLNLTIRHSPLAIISLDCEQKIESWSPAAAKIFGWEESEIIGQIIPIRPQTCQERYEQLWARVMRGEECIGEEMEALRKDGSIIHVSVSAAPIYAANPHIIGGIAIYENISERKKNEQAQRVYANELKNLTAELEKRVAARTAKLEAVNNELKEFASIISHDLKAPLRAISHLAGWLNEDYGQLIDDKGQRLINMIINSTRKMDGLINGILEYSRVGHGDEQTELLDLNFRVREVIELLAPPPHINIVLENTLPTLVCNRFRIGQIFQNLLSNAIKFLDKPVGEIRIGSSEMTDAWKFWIQDNGKGIDAKHFTRIFQIFHTLAPQNDSESSGLGLTLVKKIVELYDGQIWLESMVGQGSTFFFTLPKQNFHRETRGETR